MAMIVEKAVNEHQFQRKNRILMLQSTSFWTIKSLKNKNIKAVPPIVEAALLPQKET